MKPTPGLPHRLLAVLVSAGLLGAGAPQLDPVEFQAWLEGPASLLLTAHEVEVCQRLEPHEYALFQRWFWARRDPAPETEENEFQRGFEQRVAFADNAFGNPAAGESGWNTARGTLYLYFGRPDHVITGRTNVLFDGELRPVTEWVYDHVVGFGPLEVPLVRKGGGMAVATDATAMRPMGELRRAIGTAIEATVSRPELRLSDLIASGARAGGLPMAARVARDSGVVQTDLSIPFHELFGQPTDDGLRIWLDIRPVDADAAPLFARRRLAPLVLLVSRADLEGLERPTLQVAIFLPEEFRAARGLAIVEGATDRRLDVPLGSTGAEIPDRYAADQILSVSYLPDGRIIAIAFLAGSGRDGDPPHWVVRTHRPSPAGPIPTGLEILGER